MGSRKTPREVEIRDAASRKANQEKHAVKRDLAFPQEGDFQPILRHFSGNVETCFSLRNNQDWIS